jgi:hypothetical protein
VQPPQVSLALSSSREVRGGSGVGGATRGGPSKGESHDVMLARQVVAPHPELCRSSSSSVKPCLIGCQAA